ncbi:MAG: FecR domain-containing protein [Elusimicrobia bacterium]|nr:FecR domain-containing protein [Elusimicrobiota bacterium]
MRRPLILLAILISAVPARGQLVRIGAAAAVRGKVEALAPVKGAVGRILSSGKEVYLRDAVTTDSQGRMQVMLLDETVFTIGPNSSLVLDEFVYDPASGAGKMTARVTKGVFRFVTGKIARETPSNMRVKLPVGVIGIRGTIVMGKIYSPTSALAMLMGPGARNNADERPGQMVVSAGGKDSMASKPGSGIDMTPAGPSAPYTVPQAKVDEMSGDLSPKASDAPAKGASASGGTASSSEGSASEESGQTTAGALSDLSQTQSVSETSTESGTLTQDASQTVQDNSTSNTGGVSTWDALAATSLPDGYYNTSGVAACSGSYCGASGSASYSAFIDISFASNMITGASFSVAWPGGGGFSNSTMSGPINFGSGSGPAQVMSMAGYLTNPAFNNTNLTFLTDNGVAGAKLSIDLHANNGQDSISGCTGLATGSYTLP